jgi:hypothetical protein
VIVTGTVMQNQQPVQWLPDATKRPGDMRRMAGNQMVSIGASLASFPGFADHLIRDQSHDDGDSAHVVTGSSFCENVQHPCRNQQQLLFFRRRCRRQYHIH